MGKVTAMLPGTHLSVRAFAEETGQDRETLAARVRTANIQPSGQRGGRPVYRLRDLLRAAYVTTDDGEIDPDKLRPFERHAHYKAEREKLNLQVERGELLPSLHVEQRYAAMFKTVAEVFDTLPDVLERDCGATALLLAKIESRLDAAREALYSRLIETPDDDAVGPAETG